MDRTWMLYGANGYTGRWIAQEAARRGLRPVLAGRRAGEVKAIARTCGCASRVFALERVENVVGELSGIAAVLNCAGPFSRTAPNLMEACLRAKTKYLDITGEIDVIERAAALAGRAKSHSVPRRDSLPCPHYSVERHKTGRPGSGEAWSPLFT